MTVQGARLLGDSSGGLQFLLSSLCLHPIHASVPRPSWLGAGAGQRSLWTIAAVVC